MAGYHLHRLWVGGANHSSHLRLQRWVQPATTRGLWIGTICGCSHLRVATEEGTVTECSHFPGNTHMLLLLLLQPWLPKALGATYTSLRVTETSQVPATRSRLCHLPTGPHHCQGPSNQALDTGPAHYIHLLGSMHRLYTGTPPIKGITACTPWGKRQQASKLTANIGVCVYVCVYIYLCVCVYIYI